MGTKANGKQIWAAYNHMPGGQIVAIHFEDVTRTKKQGDGQTEILFTADDQLTSFEKSPQVALFVNEKLVKNKMLRYDQGDLRGNPRANDVVIAWAISKGMQPFQSPSDKQHVTPQDHARRIDRLEADVAGINSKVDQILAAVGKIAPAGATK